MEGLGNETLLSQTDTQNNESTETQADVQTQNNTADNQAQTDNTQVDTESAPSFTEEEVNLQLNLPEHYSQEERDSVKKLAMEMKATPEQAKAMAAYAKEAQEKALQGHAKRVDGWVTSLKEDADFGGDKFDENLNYAKIGLKAYDTDGELVKMLDESGYGSNPAVVKLFARIGKDLNEDKLVNSGNGGGSNKSAAEILYGK